MPAFISKKTEYSTVIIFSRDPSFPGAEWATGSWRPFLGVRTAFVNMASGKSNAGPTCRRLQQIQHSIRWGCRRQSFTGYFCVVCKSTWESPSFCVPVGTLAYANNDPRGGQLTGWGWLEGNSPGIQPAVAMENLGLSLAHASIFKRMSKSKLFVDNLLILNVGSFLNRRYFIGWIQQSLSVGY